MLSGVHTESWIALFDPDVSKGIFRVLCNHFSRQVLKEQHTLDNWMNCCVIPIVVAPSLCDAEVIVHDN